MKRLIPWFVVATIVVVLLATLSTPRPEPSAASTPTLLPVATMVTSAPGMPAQRAVVDGSLRPVGFHRYTDLDTSCDLTDHGTYTIPATAHLAVINITDQNVRWRDFPRTLGDTTDPTATVGMQIAAAAYYVYNGRLDWIEFIEEVAGAEMTVSFYGL